MNDGQQASLCSSTPFISDIELPKASVNLLLSGYQWDFETNNAQENSRTKVKAKLKTPKFKKNKRKSKQILPTKEAKISKFSYMRRLVICW